MPLSLHKKNVQQIKYNIIFGQFNLFGNAKLFAPLKTSKETSVC